jgi:protein LTV1
LLGDEAQSDPKLARVGQASLYGIYYDDSEYDYMQHLRTVGMQEEGVESILIEAPSTSKGTQRSKTKSGIEIPDEALPSTYELPRTYETQQAVPESIAGFHPDMDPHLRQTLEALEDDAFVDDGLEDGFFAELVGEGQRYSDEEFDYEFDEDGVPSDGEGGQAERSPQNEGEMTWEDRFKQFKKEQATAKKDHDSDDDFASEGGDTIGTLQTMSMSVIGGKKRRRKGGSDATGYSMSSSSMFRHDGLKTLDERFDQVCGFSLGASHTFLPLSDDVQRVRKRRGRRRGGGPPLRRRLRRCSRTHHFARGL